MDRDEFARQFIERGKASGASKDDVKMKLQVALNEYDSNIGSSTGQPTSQPSFLESTAKAIIKPAKDYGKMVLGSMYEIPRGLKANLKGDYSGYMDASGKEIPNPFLDQKELEQFSDPQKASLEGTKRAVGMASYFPAGSLPKAIAAGSMYAFSQVDDDAKVDQYVAETLTGGVGGGLGYGITKLGGALWSKLTDKVSKLVNSAPEISPEMADTAVKRIMQRVNESGSSEIPGVKEQVYGSGLPFSKAGHSFDKLKPQQTFKTMLEDEIWGTPAQISNKVDIVTGDKGILSNIVKESLNEIGDVDVPSGLIDMDTITGKYTTLGKKEIGDLTTRLGRSAPGGSISGKNAGELFDFQRQLEKEAYDVLQKGSSSGKVTEFAQLKLDLARKIEGVIDKAIEDSGTSNRLATDPAIIAYLNKNVSPNLARKVANSGGDLRLLRSLQKDYYRMGQIVDLSTREGSSLGNNYFSKWIGLLPGVGATLSALSGQAEAYVGTALPIVSKRVAQTAGDMARPIAGTLGKTASLAGSTTKRIAPIVGSQVINSGLGKRPPQL